MSHTIIAIFSASRSGRLLVIFSASPRQDLQWFILSNSIHSTRAARSHRSYLRSMSFPAIAESIGRDSIVLHERGVLVIRAKRSAGFLDSMFVAEQESAVRDFAKSDRLHRTEGAVAALGLRFPFWCSERRRYCPAVSFVVTHFVSSRRASIASLILPIFVSKIPRSASSSLIARPNAPSIVFIVFGSRVLSFAALV